MSTDQRRPRSSKKTTKISPKKLEVLNSVTTELLGQSLDGSQSSGGVPPSQVRRERGKGFLNTKHREKTTTPPTTQQGGWTGGTKKVGSTEKSQVKLGGDRGKKTEEPQTSQEEVPSPLTKRDKSKRGGVNLGKVGQIDENAIAGFEFLNDYLKVRNAALESLRILKAEPLHNADLASEIEKELDVTNSVAESNSNYQTAKDHLVTQVEPKLVEARKHADEAAKVREEATRTLAAAEKCLMLLGGMELADIKPLDAIVDKGRVAFGNAEDRDGYQAVIDALQGYEKAFQEASDAVAPALLARADYQSQRETALRHLGQGRVLPGADNCPPVKNPVEAIAQSIDTAEKSADKAQSANDFRQALDQLKGTATRLSEAVTASDIVAEAHSALMEAKSKVFELSKFKFVDPSIPQATVDEANSKFTTATTADTARTVVAKLANLDKEIAEAKKAAAEAFAARETFDNAAAKAEKKVAEAKTLPSADSFPPLLRVVAMAEHLIADAVQRADQATDVQTLTDAADRLVAVDRVLSEAPKLSEKSTELMTKLGEAEPRAKKLRAMKFPDPSQVLTHFDNARKAIDDAKTLDEAKASTEHLADFQKAYERFQKDNKSALEQRTKFLERRTECVEALSVAASLRGADREIGPVHDVVEEMRLKLDTANRMFTQAQATDEIRDARVNWLDQFGKLKEAAEKASKQIKKEDDEDLAAMNDYLSNMTTLERERAEVELMPGCEEWFKKMCVLQLEAKAMLNTDGPITTGYKAALKHLQAYKAMVLEARKTSKELQSQPLPETVKDAVQVATDKLEILRNSAPQSQCDAHAVEIARAQAKGHADEDAALQALQAIADEISSEVILQEKFRADCRRLLVAVQSHVDSLKKDAPGADPVKKLEADFAEAQEHIVAKDYTTAFDKLEACDKVGASLVQTFQGSRGDWLKESKDLEALKGRCGELRVWPPTAGPAAKLMQDFSLAASTADKYDYQGALQIFRDASGRLTSLELEFSNSGAAGQDVRALGQGLKDARIAVEQARGTAQDALKALSGRLEGVRNNNATKPHEEFAQADLFWNDFFNDPTRLASGSDLPDMIANMKDMMVKRYTEIKQAADALADGTRELRTLRLDLVAVDQKEDADNLPERIKALLSQLEAIIGAPVPERSEFASAGTSVAALRKIEQSLVRQIESNKDKLSTLVAEVQKQVETLRKIVKGWKVGEITFKDYYARVLEELDDADGVLANSADDFELVKETRDGLKELVAGVKSVIVPDKGDTTQSDVKALWGDMSSTLGATAKGTSDSTGKWGDIQRFLSGKWDIIQSRMPTTYTILRAELETAVKESKRMHPKDAISMMEPLQAKIKEAFDAAVLQQQLYEKFKIRRDEVKSLYDKIVEKTKTKYTEKCEAFAERMSTRFSDAKALANDERGGLHKAFNVLDEIETDLLKIQTSDNPRGELKRLDSECEQEMRLVRDAAKQFNAEYEFLTETLFGEVKSAIEKAKGDTTQLDSLKSQASGAKKIVSQYLDIISNWPHEYVGTKKLPPIDRMVQDYGRARGLLAEITDSAKRLREFPTGTDIILNESLDKIKKDWYDGTLAFGGGIRNLADVIVKRADAPPEHADTARKVSQAIKDIPRRFLANAFDDAFKVLGDDKADKGARKAAREEALKIVRRVRRDLEADPLLVAANDTANPFRNVNVENSRILTALREVEYKVVGRV
jgi:hypothetical protein